MNQVIAMLACLAVAIAGCGKEQSPVAAPSATATATARAPAGKATTDAAIFTAAKKGDLTEVKRLVGAGASVNAANDYKWTVLHYAVWGGICRLSSIWLGKGLA